MVSISLNDLNKNTVYSKTLQVIEDFCDEYELSNDFGTISTANQEIIDYLSNTFDDFCVEFMLDIDNQELSITYYSFESIFNSLLSFDADRNIIKNLCDDLELSSDNKLVSLTFHVKPKFQIKRDISIKRTQTIHI